VRRVSMIVGLTFGSVSDNARQKGRSTARLAVVVAFPNNIAKT